MAAKTKVEIDIDITPDMLAAGLQVLVDSGVLNRSGGRELPVNGYQDPRIDGGEVVTTMHGRVEGCL